jgi:hypothetical protein
LILSSLWSIISINKKLLDVIGKREEDEDTQEIDDLLESEIKKNDKVVIMACIKGPREISLDMNIVNNQIDSDEEGITADEDGSGQQLALSDSD